MSNPIAKGSFVRRHLLTCENLSSGEIDALDFGAKASASEGQDFQVEDSCHGAPYALVSTVTFSLISKDIGGAIAKLGYDQVCGEVAR